MAWVFVIGCAGGIYRRGSKVDRSFMCKIHANPEDLAIVRPIVALARALDLETVAEGVETAGQWRPLRA